jgi:hypothetical protein
VPYVCVLNRAANPFLKPHDMYVDKYIDQIKLLEIITVVYAEGL